MKKFRSPLESLLTMRALKDKLRDTTQSPTIPKKHMTLKFPPKPRIK